MGSLFGASLDAQVDANLASRSFHGAFDDGVGGGRSDREARALTNSTTYELNDNLTVRNIFGYRKNFSIQLVPTGGVGPLFLPTTMLGAPADTPFTLFHGSGRFDRKHLSNELQLVGDYDRWNFIVGAFYNKDEPNGPSGTQFEAFSTPGTPSAIITSLATNENYAAFAQVGYSISPQLTLNLGARYSWDKAEACGGFFPGGFVGLDVCEAEAGKNLIDGIGVVSNQGEEPSWTVGLDYKVSPDWLLYGVTRRGYCGANVNTPLFETPFTTGAPAGCTFGACPDLRPFQKTGEEKLTDLEIGSKYNFYLGGLQGRFNIDAYYSVYEGALQFINAQTLGIPNDAPDSPSSGSFGANVADINIWGFEGELFARVSDDLTFSLNGAYTNQKVKDLTVPPGFAFTEAEVQLPSPKYSGTASASYTFPFRPGGSEIVLHGDIFYTDDFAGQSGESLPGYTLANFRFDWRNIGGTPVTASVYVRNAFDEEYFSAASVLLPSFPTSSVYAGEQRSIGMTLAYRF